MANISKSIELGRKFRKFLFPNTEGGKLIRNYGEDILLGEIKMAKLLIINNLAILTPNS